VKWSLLSESNLIFIYQNQSLYDPAIVNHVKEEAMHRGLISNTFEAMLQEKC